MKYQNSQIQIVTHADNAEHGMSDIRSVIFLVCCQLLEEIVSGVWMVRRNKACRMYK